MPKTTFASQLLHWYDRHRRSLPWRLSADASSADRIDPYLVLVSEAMLQQTQVATVIDYFRRFIAQFPTIGALAKADPQDVLRAWQGLGYYSRARNLQSAARMIVAEFGGEIPSNVDELLKLPGVGRYTAGALASIAFDRPAPIVDGNVSRVLCRLEAMKDDPRGKGMQEWLWKRAEQIIPTRRIGDFNSAMMELGALVCTPKSPKCLLCPVKSRCRALAERVVDQIPPPRKRPPRPIHRRQVFAIHCRGRYLIEQRPAKGRWAGMWQFITHPWDEDQSQCLGIKMDTPQVIGELEHELTHRQYQFQVLYCQAKSMGKKPPAGRVWVTLAELSRYPLSRPHLKVAQMLARREDQADRRRLRGSSSSAR
ncbi:MAG: A/G-specific adenine glycosylase [Phycisphaerales bacterium]|jgi:A/G-specific adenine glycosylase|nr:A/G-specific adenine glycosylase [Phycisphaerales bacterium]